jgi:hypothetical protein
LAPHPGTKRELFAWIWYPAAARKPSQETDDYLPASWRTAVEQHRGRLINFSVDGAMLKSPPVMRALRALGTMHLDGRRQVAVTTQCISSFFDVYLKGAPASTLKSQLANPEIRYVE